MELNTLKITNQILRNYNIKANKRYGQNFLIADDILSNIIKISNICEDELIIEIGPGLGNLSEYLLLNSTYCLLIEIDNKMIEVLTDRLSGKFSNYTLLNEDILNVDIDKIINDIEIKSNMKFSKVKVIANLPYYITSPIIFKLLQESNRIDEIIVMVQKEVAERITANNKSKEYGILTLMIKYYCEASIQIIVPNTSFIPPPDVTSAVVKMIKRKKYFVKNEKLLFELIHFAFQQRRKKMINSLVSNHFNNMTKEELEEVFKNCDINLNVRAEELELEKYIEIVNLLYKEE